MDNMHRRRWTLGRGEIVKCLDQRFATGKIDTDRWLIKQQKWMASKQRTGEQDPLAFALGAPAKVLIDDPVTAQLMQKFNGVGLILFSERRPPCCKRAVTAGQYHLARGCISWETVSNKMSDRSNSLSQFTQVGPSDQLPKDVHLSCRRMTLRASE